MMANQELAKTNLFAERRGGSLVLADQGVSTGRRIWVHAGTGTDEGGAGADPDNPVATLDYAVGLCTANQGDMIYLMPGHTETKAVAGELADLDEAGIIIEGMGVGADRPIFNLTHADAQITVDGASITIRNIRVVSGVADCVQALDVGANADGLTLENCEFEDGGSDVTELTDAIVIATGCDDVTIRGCRFLTATGGTITSAITFEGTHDNALIEKCYFNGDFATAAIVGSAGTGTRIRILDNWIKVLDGEPGIELKSDTVGIICRNHIETTTLADPDTAIVAADCSWFLNYAVVTDGKGAEMIGAMETGSVEGKVDSVGTLVSIADSKVVSAHVLSDSKVVSAHVVTDSKIVSAHVVTDSKIVLLATEVASADSSILSAHVITDSTLTSAHVVTDALVTTTLSTSVAAADSSILSAHVITDSTLTSAHVVTDTAVGTQNTAVSVAESKAISVHVLTDSKVVSAHVVTDALVNTTLSTAVAAADSSILSAHVITDSTLTSAHVVTDALVETTLSTAVASADSSILSAHVITDSTLTSAHVVTDALVETTLSTAIASADSSILSAHVVTNTAVDSVGTQVTTLDNWDVRTVSKASLALTAGTVADAFTVANGPVKLLGLITHATEAVSADACTFKWQSDPTTGASSTDLCGNVDINAMAIGSGLYVAGPSASAGVIAAPAAIQPMMCSPAQIVLPGGIDMVLANSDPSTGIATVYLVYRPMTATAAVTAA